MIIQNEIVPWLEQRREKIWCACVSHFHGHDQIVIVREEVPYDAQFEDELTEFDIDLAARFPDLQISFLCLPRCDDYTLAGFLGEDAEEFWP